jgi:hypothetical protein
MYLHAASLVTVGAVCYTYLVHFCFAERKTYSRYLCRDDPGIVRYLPWIYTLVLKVKQFVDVSKENVGFKALKFFVK